MASPHTPRPSRLACPQFYTVTFPGHKPTQAAMAGVQALGGLAVAGAAGAGASPDGPQQSHVGEALSLSMMGIDPFEFVAGGPHVVAQGVVVMAAHVSRMMRVHRLDVKPLALPDWYGPVEAQLLANGPVLKFLLSWIRKVRERRRHHSKWWLRGRCPAGQGLGLACCSTGVRKPAKTLNNCCQGRAQHETSKYVSPSVYLGRYLTRSSSLARSRWKSRCLERSPAYTLCVRMRLQATNDIESGMRSTLTSAAAGAAPQRAAAGQVQGVCNAVWHSSRLLVLLNISAALMLYSWTGRRIQQEKAEVFGALVS